MIRTIEAIIDDEGKVQLLEPVPPGSTGRALVLILDEPAVIAEESARLSEAALGDWNRPEEDQAWLHLQREK